jgi:hypothetical protein
MLCGNVKGKREVLRRDGDEAFDTVAAGSTRIEQLFGSLIEPRICRPFPLDVTVRDLEGSQQRPDCEIGVLPSDPVVHWLGVRQR